MGAHGREGGRVEEEAAAADGGRRWRSGRGVRAKVEGGTYVLSWSASSRSPRSATRWMFSRMTSCVSSICFWIAAV